MPNGNVILLPLLLTITLVLIPSSFAYGETIRVPQDRPTIQAGIDDAMVGDTVLVADGMWTGPGNRDLDPGGKAITIRSTNGPAACVIDCQGNAAAPHRGFHIHSGEGNDCVIEGFTIAFGYCMDDDPPWSDGGGIWCQSVNITITDCVIARCRASDGGGIHCSSGGCIIRGCTILDNIARVRGGGIYLVGNNNQCLVEDSLIVGNSAGTGAGVNIYISSHTILRNCQISENIAEHSGGGISSSINVGVNREPLFLSSCTISGNTAVNGGGGIDCYQTDLTIENSIIWANNAGWVSGREIDFWTDYSYYPYPFYLTLDYTDVDSDAINVNYDNEMIWGSGMITAEPLFISGPLSSYYLSQTAAGQADQSPCVDTGHPLANMVWGTTRTDERQDDGTLDMGWHAPYPTENSPETMITAGAEGTADSPVLVWTFSGVDSHDPPESLTYSWRVDNGNWTGWAGRQRASFSNLTTGPHTFEVRSRNSDGFFDPTPARRRVIVEPWDEAEFWGPLVTGPGPGPANPPLVRTSHSQWLAYGVMQRGVNVAAGDLNGDAIDEIITGPGPGEVFGAHVRGWKADGTPLPWLSYLAYGTRRFGVNVACGDLDGDTMAEIVTGAGPGAVFGPHVRGWNSDGGPAVPLPGVSFFAYGTLRWGVNVACGDLDGDGMDEIITGAGPGPPFGPHVRGWDADGGSASPMSGISFFAYNTPQWGVNVGSGDIDGDGLDEIITAPGPSPAFSAHVRAWDYDGAAVNPAPGISFLAYGTVFGAVVSAADLDNDGTAEILTMPGPNPAAGARVRIWEADNGTVSEIESLNFLAYDEWMTYGGRIAAGNWE